MAAANNKLDIQKKYVIFLNWLYLDDHKSQNNFLKSCQPKNYFRIVIPTYQKVISCYFLQSNNNYEEV